MTELKASNIKFDLTLTKCELWTHKIRTELIKFSEKGINSVYDDQYGKVQSCLYAFEDSQNVIDEYKQLEDFKAIDSGYLKLYGLLQALFVQQDSLRTLRMVLNGHNTDLSLDYKGLYRIRGIRNMTVGHPTNNSGEYFLISQTTLNKYGYQIVGYRKSGKTELIDVDTFDILQIQDKEISEFMKLIFRELVGAST